VSLSPPSFHPASPPHPTALTARAPGRSLKDVFETGQAYVALSRVSSLEGLRLKGFNPAVVRANARVKAFYADMDACAPAPAPAPARPPRRCARSTRAPTGSDAPCSLHPARPRYRDARPRARAPRRFIKVQMKRHAREEEARRREQAANQAELGGGVPGGAPGGRPAPPPQGAGWAVPAPRPAHSRGGLGGTLPGGRLNPAVQRKGPTQAQVNARPLPRSSLANCAGRAPPATAEGARSGVANGSKGGREVAGGCG